MWGPSESSWLLALAWLGCCRHVGKEPVDGRSFALFSHSPYIYEVKCPEHDWWLPKAVRGGWAEAMVDVGTGHGECCTTQ